MKTCTPWGHLDFGDVRVWVGAGLGPGKSRGHGALVDVWVVVERG